MVELDGAYHDRTAEADITRQRYLESQGWRVLRFAAEEVEADPEIIFIGITRELGLEYQWRKRIGLGSGMKRR